MTHYDVSYAGLEGDEKQAKALQDIREYMGDDKFVKVCLELRKGGKPEFESFQTACSFGGIQGYPVRALYEHLWPNES